MKAHFVVFYTEVKMMMLRKNFSEQSDIICITIDLGKVIERNKAVLILWNTMYRVRQKK